MKTRKGEKRGHVKNFFKKGVIWSLVISLLLGMTVAAGFTVAETYVDIRITVGDDIKNATEAYIETLAFVRCVKKGMAGRKTDGMGGDVSEDDIDDLFDPKKGAYGYGSDDGEGGEYSLGSDYSFKLGSWAVSQAKADGYDDDDGTFKCNGGDTGTRAPLTMFAKQIGVGELQILCNLENSELPGLIAGWNDDDDSMMTKSGCSANANSGGTWIYNDIRKENPNIATSDLPTIYGETYGSGEEYIRLLYNHWVAQQNNEYLLKIENNDLSDVKTSKLDNNLYKYFVYYNDYKAACAKTEATKGEENSVEIYSVGSDGAIKSEYWKADGASPQYNIYHTNSALTCADFAQKVRSAALVFRKGEFFDKYKKACDSSVSLKWETEKRKAELVNLGQEEIKENNGQTTILVSKSYTEEEKKAAKDFLKKYKAYSNSISGYASMKGNDETGPFTCANPDGTFVESAPYTEVTTGTAIDSCQSNAGALGWVICNVLELAGSAAESAYESFLKPQLEVNPVLIGATGNESTASAWSKFQGFANIVFAIVFLIIIFSQLTGYGIDNYGIKKILPKLVVTVILVNLSFVICQVAVDLSNILGNSLQNLFSSIKVDATLTETFEGTTDTFQISAGTQTLLWAVLVGVLVGGGIAIWRNPALLISLLVSVLGVLIAGFFVFILLAARQAAIVVLIVLSPLAFVCYALPNTKKLFDKWLKLMQSLLLVYPICGLLIGGGDFASRLLLSAGLGTSFAAGLTAMLVGIVPIFFIPTVLKNSMSALGGLGAKILERGNKISGGAKSTLRNTRAYKNAQERGKARGDRKFAQARAGVHLDKETGKFVNSKNPIAWARRRTAGSWIGRHLGTDAAMGEQQAKLRSMEEKQQQNAMTAEVGVAPLVNASNLKQKMQNAINEAVAENEVPVVPVDVELAIQRRKSANEAQELKNYKDQFAEYSKAQLEEEAGRAGDWLSKDGGTQRMQALLSAMESQGMQKSMAGVLEKHGDVIGNNAKIMQTLAGSKDKVFKAYGKAGAGQSYKQFMSGTGNGKSLADYVKEKDVDFLDGLDDKALAQIRKYQTSDNNIMSGSMLAQAAAKINSQDATDEIDEMIRSKIESGEKVEFSAAQYANLNTSTQEMLDSLHRSGNSSVGDNLIRISNDMINAPEQYAKLNFNEKDANGNGVNGSGTYLNEARARAGLGTMQDAIQSLHVPHSS